MKRKFQPITFGPVGGLALSAAQLKRRPPYRDQQIADQQNISWKRVGLDTPLKEHSGLLDQRGNS
jgi:hypothetical protein